MFYPEPIPALPQVAPLISRILHIPVYCQDFIAPTKGAGIVYFLYDLVRNTPLALEKLGLESIVLPELSLSAVRKAMSFYFVGKPLGDFIGSLSKDQKVLFGLFKVARALYKQEETRLRLRVAEKAFACEDPRVLVEKEALDQSEGHIRLGMAILTDDRETLIPLSQLHDSTDKSTDSEKTGSRSALPVPARKLRKDRKDRKENWSPVTDSMEEVVEDNSDSEDSDSCYVVNDSPLRASCRGLMTDRQHDRNKQNVLRRRYKTGREFYASRPDMWDRCPLTGEKFTEPVVAADGITYEAAAWKAWISENDLSPFVEEVLQHKRSVPNQVIKCAIAVGDSNID